MSHPRKFRRPPGEYVKICVSLLGGIFQNIFPWYQLNKGAHTVLFVADVFPVQRDPFVSMIGVDNQPLALRHGYIDLNILTSGEVVQSGIDYLAFCQKGNDHPR